MKTKFWEIFMISIMVMLCIMATARAAGSVIDFTKKQTASATFDCPPNAKITELNIDVKSSVATVSPERPGTGYGVSVKATVTFKKPTIVKVTPTYKYKDGSISEPPDKAKTFVAARTTAFW